VRDSRLKVPAAYMVVVDHLRREILLGNYAPGQKLPPEREHAEQLGVSRITLREAVRVLEGEGLVEVRRGSLGGTTIRHQGRNTAELRRQLRRRADDVRAVQEFRLAIEPLSAERAARFRTAAGLKELAATVRELEAADAIGSFRGADSAFHLALAGQAKCPPLARAIEDARIAMFEPIDVVGFDIVLARAIKDHSEILAAVEAHDADAARAAMAAHIEGTSEEFEQLF
jgi:GntR family transcriptional repressor for pyruvate dehydrogenase complex